MADRSEGMEAICIFATVVALALVPNANANAGEDWHRSAVMTARMRSGLCMTGALEYVWGGLGVCKRRYRKTICDL